EDKANFVHLTPFARRRIVGLREGRFSFRQIAVRVGQSPAEEPQHQKITSLKYWLSGRDALQLDLLRIIPILFGGPRWAADSGNYRNLACVIERHVHHTTGIVVWGAITHGSTFPLHMVRSTMTAVKYVNEVLRPTLVPYVRNIEDGVFQQNNARPHIARASLTFLEEQHIEVLP
ncbi:hypothetical protein BDFB_014197, partial [Asbolus verrucosus]